ncbi:MAG: DUF5615 family PIN-like protein [Methanosarcinales archaeon]|nr:hypothetical protein [Methanosarcinales archaeon]
MSKIRIYTDEDVRSAVAKTLHRWGYDAISTPEAGMLSTSDEKQLEFATLQKRTILTFNTKDYVQLHHKYQSKNRYHYGIIVSKRIELRELLRRIRKLLHCLSAEDMYNQLEYLGRWK